MAVPLSNIRSVLCIFIRLAHCKCKGLIQRSPCWRLSSVLRQISKCEIGTNVVTFVGNHGRKILHRKLLKTPKVFCHSNNFGSVRAYCFTPLAMQLVLEAQIQVNQNLSQYTTRMQIFSNCNKFLPDFRSNYVLLHVGKEVLLRLRFVTDACQSFFFLSLSL